MEVNHVCLVHHMLSIIPGTQELSCANVGGWSRRFLGSQAILHKHKAHAMVIGALRF